MESALYDPERGFYSRRRPRADFYTAPELHPAFGAVTARRVERLSRELGLDSARVVEMGCGEGLLAEQMLAHLPEGTPYVLVERSAPVLEAALARLRPLYPQVEGARSLEDLLPCQAVFVSNELVDAFPVHVLQKHLGEIREVYVGDDQREVLGRLSTPELHAHAAKVAETLEEGSRHAVNLEMDSWLSSVAQRLTRGALVTIDYGSKFHAQPNPPRAFFRHSQPSALTGRPGAQDLTASVDFQGLIGAGERLGFKTEFYGTLSRFLIDGGIADFMPKGDSAADCRARTQVKTLLHPEGMGEAFKVLIQTVKEGLPS
jgi:SAM-dependent MidA family methyltransferase